MEIFIIKFTGTCQAYNYFIKIDYLIYQVRPDKSECPHPY